MQYHEYHAVWKTNTNAVRHFCLVEKCLVRFSVNSIRVTNSAQKRYSKTKKCLNKQ